VSDAPAVGGLTTNAVPESVISGMASGNNVQQPAAPAPASPSAVVPAPPAGTVDALGDLPDDQAVFSRGYVENVRSQAARYRTEASDAAAALQPFQDVYGAYDDGDREVWFTLAREWATDPSKAAAIMRDIANDVLGGDAPATPAHQQQPPSELDMLPETPQELAQLTPEQVKALVDEQLAQRDQKQAVDRQVEEVFTELRAAGYEPESDEGWWILRNAAQRTNGDIGAAVKMYDEFQQKIIDKFVQGRSGNRAALAPSGGVVATGTGEAINSIEDARRATDRFLQERRAAQ
jgi:hypothetical protein